MIWDEFSSQFSFRDEEDSELSDEEQKRNWPENRPKHTRKRVHQAGKKLFVEIQNSFLASTRSIEEFLQRFEKSKTLRKVPYEEAHNLIYGAVAFAEEGALVANRQPERRGEVIEWFRKVLQFYAPRLEHQECCDGFPIK